MITREFILSNYAEAGLWIVIALGFAIAVLRKGHAPDARRDCVVAAVAFLLFGLSDVVETRTGAWWRPLWLFVWKAACVATFVVLLVRHYRRKRWAVLPSSNHGALGGEEAR
ncbi:MAG TPA: hypothetical protein VGN72_01975 [Tepidisphaeraceae bacterium]|jgi:hypothetical protein|nr:hypothetical protein [Tepidisphaeraceae bacterium]